MDLIFRLVFILVCGIWSVTLVNGGNFRIFKGYGYDRYMLTGKVTVRPDTFKGPITEPAGLDTFKGPITVPATLDTFKGPITEFSVSLFKIAKPDDDADGNKFMSPFSVMAALMLTMLGTGGNTERQIMSALHLNEISGNVHQKYKRLQDHLNTELTSDEIIVSVANRLFPRLGVALKRQYMKEAGRYYGSKVEPLDFVGQPEISRKFINNWVSNNTNNLIKDILPRGSITRDSIMFLVNAIYFKGTWKLQFNKTNTKFSDFHVSSTHREKVEMMNMKTDKLRSGINRKYDCKVLELPYKGGDFDMLIILPNSINGLSKLESKLSAGALASIFSSLRKQETVISLPKFEMLSGFKNLKDPLKQLGITDLFGNADFSKMFINPSGIFVDKVIHKAFVGVDEEGTEAAAATVVVIIKSARIPLVFNANHPFIFLIREKRSGAILFIGRYVKKQQ